MTYKGDRYKLLKGNSEKFAQNFKSIFSPLITQTTSLSFRNVGVKVEVNMHDDDDDEDEVKAEEKFRARWDSVVYLQRVAGT